MRNCRGIEPTLRRRHVDVRCQQHVRNVQQNTYYLQLYGLWISPAKGTKDLLFLVSDRLTALAPNWPERECQAEEEMFPGVLEGRFEYLCNTIHAKLRIAGSSV